MRDARIDCLRGFLILLVVLGHVVGALFHYFTGAERNALGWAYRAIYLFHMPAFFFVAGLLWSDREIGWREFLGKRSRRLLVPYLIWGFVSAFVFLAFAALKNSFAAPQGNGYYHGGMLAFPWWQPFVSLVHAGGCPNGEGFRCNSVLWFLPCMFVVLCLRRLVAPVLKRCAKWEPMPRMAVGVLLIIACWVVGGALRLYVGALPWGLDRAPRFLGFLLLGEIVRRIGLHNGRSVWGLVCVLLGWLGYLVASWYFPDLSWVYCSWGGYVAELLMATIGCCLALVLVLQFDALSGLAGVGVASLGIMVVHKFPLMIVQVTMGGAMLSGWGVLAGSVVCLFLFVSFTAWFVTSVLKRFCPLVLGEK